MNRRLQQNSEFLGAALNRKTMPAFSTKQALASSTKLQFPSEVILEQMVMKRSPSFSLGIPNINEVKVHPIRSFQNPSHPLYIQPEMMADFALSNRSTYELYDFILSRESLSSQQKQTLILAIEEAVLVMGDHATRFYMGLFYSIPSFSYPTANVPYKQHALETYATAVQTKLIKKLKMQKSWDNKDFELFNEVSVFLAPQRASAVLQAITYLEPDAALWLLTQPLKDGISQQIIAKAQAVHKLQHDIWPNGLLSPKISTNHSFKQLQAERLAALNSYAKVLDDQIMSLSKLFPQLENSSRVFPFPELQISNKIYNAARTARLKKMIENLSLRQREVKNEAKIWLQP